jgi:hypothetical protein
MSYSLFIESSGWSVVAGIALSFPGHYLLSWTVDQSYNQKEQSYFL